MQWLIALGHIGGAIVVSTILGFALVAVAVWWDKKSAKQALQELSASLGVPVDALDTPEMARKITQLSSERYSSELLRNRLSDLCGALSTFWSWLSLILQGFVLTGVIWFTLTESRDAAVFAWTVIPLALFFWVSSVAFALACKLLTGRYPGQAKAARKMIAEYMASRQDG